MKLNNLLVILAFVSVMFACQSKKAKDEKVVQEATEELAKDKNKVLPQMKSPAEFAAILQSTGAEFNPLFLADPSLVDVYLKTPEKAALMLGAYMYNLGYCIAFQEGEYIEKYYQASLKLAENLGAEKTFLALLMKRYEKNIESNDSLKYYFSETYKHASNNVKEGEVSDGYYRTLFLTGFYMEGLNTMFEVIEGYPKDLLPEDARMTILMPVAKTALNQEPNIRNIYSLLKEKVLTDDDRSNDVYEAFTDLISAYDRLNVQDKIDNNRGGELLKDEVFTELDLKVNVIRSMIVSTP